MVKYLNTTSGSEVFLTANEVDENVLFNNVSICNTSSNNAVLDLYYKKTSDNSIYYIIKDIKIPPGINIYLSAKDYPRIFSFRPNIYRLAIHNTGSSPSLTIIMK